MNILVKEVTNKRDLRKFVCFPNQLYADNKYYVPQLVSADMNTFSRKKNRAFDVCDGKFWIATDEKGKMLGRIAGIINHKYNDKVGKKICRFGWIDFINSEEVVNALLSKVEEYAIQNKMAEIEGPYGFLEFDVTGILIDGFNQVPTPYGKYNDTYYEPLILKNGYEKSVDYVEYRIKVPDDQVEKYSRVSKIVEEKYGLHQAVFKNKKEIRPYLEGVFECMNICYSKLHGYSELTKGQCDDLLNQFFTFVSPDLVSIILNKENKVVAFAVTMQDLSEALQKAKGRLFPFGFIHFIKAWKKNEVLDALLIAILPEYQTKGTFAMIAEKLLSSFHKHGIKWIESTRELADNNPIQNIWNKQEFKLHKRARTYVKLLK